MIIQIFTFFSIFNCGVTSLQASDFYIHDLPLLPKEESSIRMHAGYLPINPENDSALFFWHFAKKFIGDKSRTVIWLNGGPGQSSLIGAWTEIGPFRFLNETTIVANNGSWHLYTNLLFIDQPIGTGFSYTDKGSFIQELDKMADQFLSFLDRYVEIFPELLQDDIYLAGESFAGQYIPYIAQAILQKRSLFKLRGLLIGNGWIDPVSTYNSYLPFAIKNNLVKKDSKLYSIITGMAVECKQILSKQVHIFEPECYSILRLIIYNGMMNQYFIGNETDLCINAHDIRQAAMKPDCGMLGPPDFDYVSNYLNRQDVLSSIHVNGKKSNWSSIEASVFLAFISTHSEPSINLLPDLLRQIPIVLFSGEYDLICNHLATENMLDGMTWNDKTGFNLGNGTVAPIDPWIVEGETAGFIQYARNLTYILFHNAGHMVPYNQGRRSRAMLHQFIQLNLTHSSNQTMENNNTGVNPIMHRYFKHFILIVFTVIITVIALTGIIRYFACKLQQSVLTVPYHSPNLFRSKQQPTMYTLLNGNRDVLDDKISA
ncbi:unnamed protein product [Adineta steineri]|uniref:Pheromone-processing carboxypeptidase KEX1 n=1 Tax=Adineta steineri TaxID=433720 RepID=A0A814PZY6_9BILA|nr:unnamed protein product [Adineta steineri]CAF1176841.1 unnamed protein product [Adineta steineri]